MVRSTFTEPLAGAAEAVAFGPVSALGVPDPDFSGEGPPESSEQPVVTSARATSPTAAARTDGR